MIEKQTTLFVNGYIWQWQRAPHNSRVWQRAPPASWLLISQSSKDNDKVGSNHRLAAQGTVLAVGVGDAPAKHRAGSEVIDLAGGIVLPGLQDAHIHIGAMGESAYYVDLSECQSVQEVQQTIRQHAEDNPELPWVIGTGWDQNLWSPPNALTRVDLDDPISLPTDRPCLLYRRCWHALVANTAAMRAAGIDPESPWSSQQGRGDGGKGGHVGRIEESKDDFGVEKESGEEEEGVELDEMQRPTGLFLENSMQIMEAAVTTPLFETRCNHFAEALHRCVRSGLTAVHSNDTDATQIYAHLQDEGRLPVRVYHTRPHDEVKLQIAENIDSEQGASDGNGSDASSRPPLRLSGDGAGMVSSHRVKLFSDGSLGAETAAMKVPYINTTNKGILIHDQASLTTKVREARDAGFRVEVHAIGDRALEAVLDAFAGAGLTTEDRPIVTHCQVAGPDLRARMKGAGAVAAIQPSFVPSDVSTVMKRLSSSVHTSCYPWRSLLMEGVVCAGSSDAPIEVPDPLQGMYDAVFRPTQSRSSVGPPQAAAKTPDAFLPDERLTLEEAVWIYTAGGAIAAGEEKRLGAIQPGFMADLTVLEIEGGAEKLLEDASLLLEAKVSQVWVGGSRTWHAEAVEDDPRASSKLGQAKSVDFAGSDFPGKNGPPKRRRAKGDRSLGPSEREKKFGGGGSNNIWLGGGGLGRVGRCRCCS